MPLPVTPATPASCEAHEPLYKANAWQAYSLMELGSWVHLFAKRAAHRSDRAKAEKDLTDAQNYLNMMQAQLTHARATLPE